MGTVAKVTLEDAQKAARKHFAKIEEGIDPTIERAAAARKSTTTIGLLVPKFLAYLEAIPRAPTYIDENRRSLERKFVALHRFNPDDVKRATVAEELEKIIKISGKIASRNSRAHLRKFYSWCIGEGVAENNPVSGTNKHNSEERDRYHDEKELVQIWRQLDDENDYDVINKLLMITGARRDQIGKLKRVEVKRDDEERGPHIDLAGKQGRSKNKKRFLIPLSKQALALIDLVWDRRKDDTGYLFGLDGSKAGFSGWSKCKERLDERLGKNFEPWVLHDYRRTFDTLSQDRLKVLEHVADACLNHKGSRKKE